MIEELSKDLKNNIYLEKAVFINRAPFENLRLDLKNHSINVLSAMNGRGKTTILSYIADAFYELAKQVFYTSFEGKENKFYRISFESFTIDHGKSSIVYLRFKYNGKNIDYIDCRSKNLSLDEYNEKVTIENKIDFKYLQSYLANSMAVKLFSADCDHKKIKNFFNNNILTYFPAYRFEEPSYLNNDYKHKYKLKFVFSSELKNPIEIVSSLENISNWIMDVVLDWIINRQFNPTTKDGKSITEDTTPELVIYKNLINILNATLSSKCSDGYLQFGIERRNVGFDRISIVNRRSNSLITPNIFNLSSGELSLICLFGEILRQGDNLLNNISLDEIQGIVLIDEVDMHLHIKLQKEVLPRLFSLFPNIQFIVSSHSPFFNMGLADTLPDKSQIIDLDNQGISCAPRDNVLYKQVYDMMVDDNNKFATLYYQLQQQINLSSLPLIITEGKTDVLHIKTALQRLRYNDINVEWFDPPEKGWGYAPLKKLLENVSYLKPKRKIIGIFDRDVDVIISESKIIEKTYIRIDNTNVFAFAIPPVSKNIYNTDKISIEHYYERKDLLKENNQGRRLFLGDEFYESGNSKEPHKYQTGIDSIKNKVEFNGIIDEKVFLNDDIEFKHSVAMSKNEFARLVNEDANFSENFDFSNFEQIIDIIKKIIDLE